MIKSLLKQTGLLMLCATAMAMPVYAAEGGDQMEALRQEIIRTMYVVSDVAPGAGDQSYLNNINTVRENQNKIKLNEATRAIALGRRAVALAVESGKDLDQRREAIEQNDDVLKMLKEIAKLQAQHLQKTNEITALKAKLLALNSIENIIAGGVSTTDEDAKKNAGSGSGGSGSGSYDPGMGGGADL